MLFVMSEIASIGRDSEDKLYLYLSFFLPFLQLFLILEKIYVFENHHISLTNDILVEFQSDQQRNGHWFI